MTTRKRRPRSPEGPSQPSAPTPEFLSPAPRCATRGQASPEEFFGAAPIPDRLRCMASVDSNRRNLVLALRSAPPHFVFELGDALTERKVFLQPVEHGRPCRVGVGADGGDLVEDVVCSRSRVCSVSNRAMMASICAKRVSILFSRRPSALNTGSSLIGCLLDPRRGFRDRLVSRTLNPPYGAALTSAPLAPCFQWPADPQCPSHFATDLGGARRNIVVQAKVSVLGPAAICMKAVRTSSLDSASTTAP
jgi:hypothetical protein